MNAKKLTVAVAAMSLAGMGAAFAAGVSTSVAHNFASKTWNQVGGTHRDEYCLPCHAPHNTLDSEGFLWNHEMGASADYQVWTGATLADESLSCLGCHDGVIALDSFSGQTGSELMTGDAMLSRDLRDDHPVGVAYPTSTRYATVGTVFGGPGVTRSGAPLPTSGTTTINLPLAGEIGAGTVECTTCHTPHDNSKGFFLRAYNNNPNDPSALCVTCHIGQK